MQVVSWRLGSTLSCMFVANTNNPHGRVGMLSVWYFSLLRFAPRCRRHRQCRYTKYSFAKQIPDINTYTISTRIGKIGKSFFFPLGSNERETNVLKFSQRFSAQLCT